MGNLAIRLFAFLRLSFVKVQNGLFRGKERYVNTLKISDCQAFSPIRTVGLRDVIPSKLTAITEVFILIFLRQPRSINTLASCIPHILPL